MGGRIGLLHGRATLAMPRFVHVALTRPQVSSLRLVELRLLGVRLGLRSGSGIGLWSGFGLGLRLGSGSGFGLGLGLAESTMSRICCSSSRRPRRGRAWAARPRATAAGSEARAARSKRAAPRSHNLPAAFW